MQMSFQNAFSWYTCLRAEETATTGHYKSPNNMGSNRESGKNKVIFSVQHNSQNLNVSFKSPLIKPFSDFTVREWSMFDHLSSNLVPHNTGARKRKLAFEHMQIGVADPTGCIIKTQSWNSINSSKCCSKSYFLFIIWQYLPQCLLKLVIIWTNLVNWM